MQQLGDPQAFPAPPHLHSPGGEMAVWFTKPPGVVVQVARRGQLSARLGEWLAGPGVDLLMARFPDRERIVLVLDLTPMDGRDPAVRGLLVEAGKRLSTRLSRAVVVAPNKASAIYLASLQAGSALLRAFGVEVEVARSSRLALARLALSPAPPS